MVGDVRGNKERAHCMNLKCTEANNWLHNVLKDISSSEHRKISTEWKSRGNYRISFP